MEATMASDPADPAATAYPVQIDVERPTRFQRVQLFVRILVLIAFGMIHQSGIGMFGMLYLVLPVIAAVLITHRGGAGYLERDAGWLIAALEWVTGFYAFMLFVTDTFPLDRQGRSIHLRIVPQGSPTVGSALLRLVTSLPQLFVLVILGCIALVIAVLAWIGVLLFESYPAAMRSFQQDVVARAARLFAYHASLVQPYPSASSAVPREGSERRDKVLQPPAAHGT
jgi:hypothetical protein